MSALNDYPLLIDISTGRLLRDLGSDVQQQPRPFVQGDTYNLRVMAVKPRADRNIRRLWEFVELPSALYVALGEVGARPANGTFKLTFGGDTTSALAFNATPAQVQTALNALASITTAGGVTVSGIEGGPYQVAFVTTGARELLTGNADGLFPLTAANIYEARAGDAEVSEIQLIALDRLSAALAQTWTSLPAAAGTVTELQAGGSGVPEVQRVTISSDAYDGSFLLTFSAASSAPIPHNASAEDLTAILESVSSIGAGNVSVIGDGPSWDITFIGALTGNQPLMTVDVSGLAVPVGKQGAFNLATAGIESLVGGEAAVTAMLEVSGVVEGDHATVLQIEATVLNDGIQNAPQTGPTLPEYYTKTAVDALLGDYLPLENLVEGNGISLSNDTPGHVTITNKLAPELVLTTDSQFDVLGTSLVDHNELFFQAEAGAFYHVKLFLWVGSGEEDRGVRARISANPGDGSGVLTYGRWPFYNAEDGGVSWQENKQAVTADGPPARIFTNAAAPPFEEDPELFPYTLEFLCQSQGQTRTIKLQFAEWEASTGEESRGACIGLGSYMLIQRLT